MEKVTEGLPIKTGLFYTGFECDDRVKFTWNQYPPLLCLILGISLPILVCTEIN